jgi:hypothetical protein
VLRIWGGERDSAALMEGKDPGSRAAIGSILFHVKNYEFKHGSKALLEE